MADEIEDLLHDDHIGDSKNKVKLTLFDKELDEEWK